MNSWVHTKSMQLIGRRLQPHRVSRMMTRVVILMLALNLSSFVVNAQTSQNQHFEDAQKAAIKGQDSKAMKEVKLSLQQNPLHADSHFLLAYLLGQENQLDQSIIGFQRALTLRPDDPDILYNLGTSLLYRGEFLSAARVLERVVTLRPDFIEGYNNLAKAYYHLSLLDLSIMAYSEALQHDPGNTIASRGISLITGSGIAQGTTSNSQSLDTEGLNTPPQSEAPIKAPKPMRTPPTALNTATQSVDLNAKVKDLQDVLQDFPYLTVEQRGGTIVITGWTVDQMERDTLTRVLTKWPEVLDLSTDDVGDSNRMIEVDATIFSVIKLDQINVGFNFLRMVNMTFDVFAAGTQGDGTGFSSPGNLGNNVNLANNGWLATANIDYDVNIANAVDQHVALLARPHLTTLSGSPASFLAGGEIIFEVSGLNSGDIEPYPFGTTLLVTPTLLQTPGDTGAPRIHIVAEAGRTSILSLLSADSTNDDRTSFTKIEVQSESVLDLGQTLVLSGLSQREKTTVKSGVPILRSIPVLSLFFSNRTTIDSELSVIILLTPRDPAYIDKKTRKDFQDFVQMRRDFIEALKGEDKDLIQFKEKYPNWYEINPNRLSSHIFMAQNSEGYQKFMGQDLSSEDLKFNLLSPKLEKR